jgi:hypothetical protein
MSGGNNSRDVKSVTKNNTRSFRVILTDPLDPNERQTTPIPVEFNLNQDVFDTYSEALAVAAGDEVTILTYVVPAMMKLFVARIIVSGDNRAEYKIKVDGNTIETVRTWFTAFNNTSEFGGLLLEAGATIEIVVNNYRPTSANFNARLNGVLKQ